MKIQKEKDQNMYIWIVKRTIHKRKEKNIKDWSKKMGQI